MATQFLVANFLYSPPGLLKINDADNQLPGWLLPDYRALYEQKDLTTTTAQSQQSPQPATKLPEPDFGVFPSTLQELLGNRIQLNRLLGLSNLYYIDPEDREILQELREVRLQTIQLMLSVGRDELGRQFQSDFGDRFWAMAQSGVQKESLDANEIQQRDAIQQWLSQTPNSLHQDGGIQRFAAVLLFNPPGSVRLAEPDQNLPAWFTDGYKRYCSMAQA